MKAATYLETQRLLLRQPQAEDAAMIFQRYASDPDVTRYVGWPRHQSVADTRAFLSFSEAEWDRWPAGPYLIVSRTDGTLLGSTGLSFATPYCAATGYVLARDAWGQGYATEVLRLMVKMALEVGVERLYALCHPEHRASWRVLEKGGFEREGRLRRFTVFPNLASGGLADVLCYARTFERSGERFEKGESRWGMSPQGPHQTSFCSASFSCRLTCFEGEVATSSSAYSG